MSAQSLNDEMSGNLMTGLVEAGSVREFFLKHRTQIDWRTIASFKSDIDRLVCCDLRRAVVLAGRIAQLSALVGDPLSSAFSMASRARVLDHRGRHSLANRLYERAASALRTARLSKEAAIIHKQQLHSLIQLGRYQDALRIARAARRVLARSEPVELGQLEANIGNIYYRLDRYKRAMAHYDKARDILSTSGDPSMLALIDFSRSNVFAETDRSDEALALLNRAAAQFQQAGRLLQSWQARFRIAYLKFLRGNYNGALASYYEALDRLTEMGSTELVGYCHLEMAEVLLALNAFQDAAENAKSAETIFKQLQMPFESARTSLLQGLAAMGLGDYDQGHLHLAAAREVFAESRNTVFTALTDLYLAELAGRRDDYAEVIARAGSSLRAFIRSRLPTKTAYARLLMARASFKLDDWSKAARTIERALRDVDGVFAPLVVYSCHHLLGQIERARKRPEAALKHFRRAVQAVEQMRGGIGVDEFKSSFLHDKTEVYEDAIAACLEGGSRALLKEAFQLVESLKSRALADLLARYVRGAAAEDPDYPRQDVKSQGRARLVGLIEDLNWYSSQAGLQDESGSRKSSMKASRYRNIVVRQERRIVQSFRRMEAEDHAFSEIQHMRPASASLLRSAIEPDELVVEYFMTGDDVSAFIVSHEDIRVVRSVVSKHLLEPMLSALRFQMDKFKYATHYLGGHLEQMKQSVDERLGRLYDAVFAPLESMIDRKRVIIIPHGPLHYIPFGALHDGGGYLVDRLEITYAPSTAVLKLCRERSVISRQTWSNTESAETGGRLVALGVSDTMAPNICEEINTIKAIFPDTVDLTGNQATRENLFRFAPEARFLHLASHGCFQRDNPMFSYLKLADCRLSFYNLLDLTLKSEIVTLSACQTGVNAILPGDELHGLMRGFLYAGAPSLVVSLWTVSDQSTAEMMKEMYSSIRAGDSKRSSLRRAQLAIKQAFEHPYYWAPFVLMGSPD